MLVVDPIKNQKSKIKNHHSSIEIQASALLNRWHKIQYGGGLRLKELVSLRTIQELLGHSDVKTTEIYTHVAKGVGAMGVRSPLDRMAVAWEGSSKSKINNRSSSIVNQAAAEAAA